MSLGKDYPGQACSVARSLEVLGERWTLLVVRDAMYGVRRYADFLAHLDIPRAVLSQRLSKLVEEGVLEKRRYQDSPPREEYVLTPVGAELWVIVMGLQDWGERNLAGAKSMRMFTHGACGTELDGLSTCPTCEVRVPLEGVVVVPSPNLVYSRTDPVSVALRSPHRMLDPVP